MMCDALQGAARHGANALVGKASWAPAMHAVKAKNPGMGNKELAEHCAGIGRAVWTAQSVKDFWTNEARDKKRAAATAAAAAAVDSFESED